MPPIQRRVSNRPTKEGVTVKNLWIVGLAFLFAAPALAQDRPNILAVPAFGVNKLLCPNCEHFDLGVSGGFTPFINLKEGRKHWLGPRVTYVFYNLDAEEGLSEEKGSAKQLEIAAVYRLMTYQAKTIAPFFETGLGVALRDGHSETKFQGIPISTDSFHDTRALFTIGGGIVFGGDRRVRGEARANYRFVSTEHLTGEESGVGHLNFSFGVVIGIYRPMRKPPERRALSDKNPK